MAHFLRRPVLSASVLQFSRCLQQRQFRAVPAQCGLGAASGSQTIVPRQEANRSVRLAAKQQQQFPSDIGLLPATFVAPSRANRPSLFSEPLSSFKLQWIRLRSKSRDLLTLIFYKWQTKPRLKLGFRRTAPTAVGLHQQMYTAFAEGDIQTLNRICGEGLLVNFRTRIGARQKGETWEWEVVKYTRRARVMSHRGASLGIEGLGIRQAVVRISSRQKLTRYKVDGAVVPNTGKERDVTEYLVIQRSLKKNSEQDWIVWGTTEETSLQKHVEEEAILAEQQ